MQVRTGTAIALGIIAMALAATGGAYAADHQAKPDRTSSNEHALTPGQSGCFAPGLHGGRKPSSTANQPRTTCAKRRRPISADAK